jgi:hypothetical protein
VRYGGVGCVRARCGSGDLRPTVFYANSSSGAFDRSCRDTNLAASSTAFRLNETARLWSVLSRNLYVTSLRAPSRARVK